MFSLNCEHVLAGIDGQYFKRKMKLVVRAVGLLRLGSVT